VWGLGRCHRRDRIVLTMGVTTAVASGVGYDRGRRKGRDEASKCQEMRTGAVALIFVAPRGDLGWGNGV
jgi:hypothetical protein